MMKFDDVLHEVGEFGTYQKRLVTLVCLTGGCVILQNLSPVFTMAIPKHRCQIPGLPNDTYEVQSEYHAWLINHTIPMTTEGDYSTCTVYDVMDPEESNGFNRTERTCEQWVYDRSVFTETLTSQLNLVCDKKLYRSHTSMMIFAGKFIGAFLTSVSGDHFGRRRVYTVMLLAMLASAVGLIFVTSLPALMALRFLAGGTSTGCYLCTDILGMELVGKSQRRYVSVAYNLSSITMSLMAVLSAFLLRHWAHFQASLAAPCVIIAVGYFFIPESPRWLMSKGRVKEFQTIMSKVARANGVSVPLSIHSAREDEGSALMPSPAAASGSASPLQMFRIPRLFVRYNLLYLCWIFIIMNLYGLMLNVSTMSGNIFLNFAILNFMDFLSLVLFTVLIERIGRRPLLVGVSALGGLACLATIFPSVLGGSPWILRGLSMVGRMGTSAAVISIYIMSPELFPTVLRSFGLGSCSMLARIGGLASPYVADLNTFVNGMWGPALPQVVFGAAGVTTSCMVLVLPETKGQRLPETIQDAAVFGRGPTGPQETEIVDLVDEGTTSTTDTKQESCVLQSLHTSPAGLK